MAGASVNRLTCSTLVVPHLHISGLSLPLPPPPLPSLPLPSFSHFLSFSLIFSLFFLYLSRYEEFSYHNCEMTH